jgi:hypothetical protein
LIDEWREVRPADLFKEVWPDLTGSIEETRITRVYADAPYRQITRPKPVGPLAHYDWENDLEMALLALEAKRFLRERGVRT